MMPLMVKSGGVHQQNVLVEWQCTLSRIWSSGRAVFPQHALVRQ